jgi:hypothetical protein
MQQLGGRRRAAAVETRDDQLVAQNPTSSSAWSRRGTIQIQAGECIL